MAVIDLAHSSGARALLSYKSRPCASCSVLSREEVFEVQWESEAMTATGFGAPRHGRGNLGSLSLGSGERWPRRAADRRVIDGEAHAAGRCNVYARGFKYIGGNQRVR
jgi:hypothetical protein